MTGTRSRCKFDGCATDAVLKSGYCPVHQPYETCHAPGCFEPAGRGQFCEKHRLPRWWEFWRKDRRGSANSATPSVAVVRRVRPTKTPEHPPAGSEGALNPARRGAKAAGSRISALCPSCNGVVTATTAGVEIEFGIPVLCESCKTICVFTNLADEPGPQPTANVTAGICIPIKEFVPWFNAHPVKRQVVGTSTPLAFDPGDEYGALAQCCLWGFCASCLYQFRKSVIALLPVEQRQRSAGVRGVVFGAASDDSARDMDALRQYRCPKCEHTTMIAVLAEPPDGMV